MEYKLTASYGLDNLIKHFNSVNVNSGQNINLLITGLKHIEKYFPEIAEQFSDLYGKPIKYAIEDLEQDKRNLTKIHNACKDVVDKVKRFEEVRSSKNLDNIDNSLPNHNPQHYEMLFGTDGKLSLQTLVHLLKKDTKETLENLYETQKYWEGDHKQYMRHVEDLHKGTYIKVLRIIENLSQKSFASWPNKVADGFEKLSKDIFQNHKGLATFIYYLAKLHPEFNAELEKALGAPVKEYLLNELNNKNVNEDMVHKYKDTINKLNEETNEHIKKENITFTQDNIPALAKKCPLSEKNSFEDNVKILTEYVEYVKKTLRNDSEKLDTTIKSQHFSDQLNAELDKKHDKIMHMGMGEIENLWNKVKGPISSSISTPNQ